MPRICYVKKRFSCDSLAIVRKANEIIAEYQAGGYDLTLRQLYYQFVARALIANEDSEYKRLGGIVADARMAGLIDWEAITDRTRYLRSNSHWDDPVEIIHSAARSYARDKWANQANRIEVWIEKDALVGVIAGVCERLDVPYFSCRGYASASEMWAASRRLLRHIENGQEPVILHLGDHDPSGKDMSRDIVDRLELFSRDEVRFQRLALNMDQVEHYDPPPNPAKITDSRAAAYIAEFGNDSWEIDALDPAVLSSIVENAILAFRDEDLWEAEEQQEAAEKAGLAKAAKLVEKYLGTNGNGEGRTER